MTRPPRNSESGFALLMIYAMAAIVAITLYMELPRVAFEAQRDKEQLLIDRGEQYSRGVMLYVRKFNRYPADFDALQSTQNLRFLRRKYIDPMTGKDDWRIIHVGPGGVFTDSLLYTKKKDPNKPDVDPNTTVTQLQQTGGNQAGGQAGVNIATRQRPSDQPGAAGDVNNPQQPQAPPNGQPFPNNPGGVNGPVQVLPNGQIVPASQGQPNQNGGTLQMGGGLQMGQAMPAAPAPGQPFPNQATLFPNQGRPNQGQPNQAGQLPPGSPFPNTQPFPNNQQTGFQNAAPGQPQNVPPTAAANLINQILTSPRPGGLNGIQQGQQATVDQFGNPLPNNGGGTGFAPGAVTGNNPGNNTGTPVPQATGGQTIGGGIAGVASKMEQDGVKVYRDRTSYNEWEFVYDITKDSARGGTTAQTGNTAPQGNPAAGTPPFGSSPPGGPAGTANPAMGGPGR
jgi:hypothetical protein